ncbi:MAG: cupin domain-containing protein [Hyphomicrobiales bacterium]|nr:cupin domain-containing protein [Hyphomicrobiales bacterium]
MNAEMEGVVGRRIDLFGPTVEFLSAPSEAEAFCALRGTIPQGAFVPLHSHPDDEDFYIVSGEILALRQGAQGYESTVCRPGDHVRLPGGVRHGFRNVSSGPSVSLVVTTATLGRFFLEMGRPLEQASLPPTPEDFVRRVSVAAKYGYWLASPEENAAVGIRL